ncbi:MAG TPA: WD40 repeat domain-containing protein, partial [Blastocatellia bacterium]|nr:WD40 repeat domain-containing protein [Blastocatellia bacterium]
NCLDWSADGRLLMTGSSDGTVKIWDAFAKDLPLTPVQPVKRYYATAFTPGGELVALCTTGDKHTRLWNLSTGRQLADLGDPKAEILVAVFSRDGQTVALSYENGRVVMHEAYTGRRIRTLTGLTTAVKGLSFSPDGRVLVSGSEQANLNLWDVMGESEVVSLNSGNGYYCTAFSPDGKLLASADGDGTIQLWEVASLRNIRSFRGHQGMIRSLAFSADGRLLASGSDDHTVGVWEVSSGSIVARSAQVDSVYRLAFSPDGKRLVTGGNDGAVILWNTADMQEMLTLKGFTRQVSSLTFSGDGMTLAASSEDGTVRVWQAAPMNE